VEDLNTPLSSIDRTSRQNINIDILELNNTMDEMDIYIIHIYIYKYIYNINTDIYRVFHPTAADYTFF
jgi:hypothetical protein